MTDPVPCHADTAYISVMLFGKAEKVTDPEETTAALQILVEKYMPQYYSQPLNSTFVEKYRSSHDGKGVSVYRVTPQQITAKENSVEAGSLFKPETR